MAYIDVTSKIERLEVFEERLGVSLESLSAFVDNGEIHVYGELQSRNGTGLQENVELVIAVYDSSGRIIGTNSRHYNAKEFFGLETLDIQINPLNMKKYGRLPEPVQSQVSKVRIYPKKG